MQNKYTVIFILPSMEMGGVAKMLISTLNCIDKNKYEIFVLLFQKKGELINDIPEGITVLETGGISYENLRKSLSEKLIRIGCKRIFSLIKSIYHRLGKFLIYKRKGNQVYDIAIAFQDGMTTWFTAKNIYAQHKLAVVHTDFKQAKYDIQSEKNIYKAFEIIYCTSESAKKSFLSGMPQLENNTKVWIPHTDTNFIHKQIVECCDTTTKFGQVRIVTVARLSHEKGIKKAIMALAKLLKMGYDVEWYFIGDGPEREKLYSMAQELGCCENAIFVGNVENPYSFMAASDIYVQPSNYESYCMTLAEARSLGCTIVTSDFPSAHEQLGDKAGLITGKTWESLYDGIKKLLDDPQLRKIYSEESKRSFEQNNHSDNILLRDLEKIMKI